MAETVRFYDSFLTNLMLGKIDFQGNEIRAAMMTPEYVFSSDSQIYSDLTEEVAYANYPSGGVVLHGRTVTNGVFDAADVEYPTGTFTVRSLVLYVWNADANLKYLIGQFDYGEDISVRTNKFLNKWSDSGVIHAFAGGLV